MKECAEKTWQVFNLSQFRQMVAEVEPLIKARSLLLLDGPMAAGKTTFVKEFAAIRGISGVSSPTFALLQSYAHSAANSEIHHLDLFRLQSKDELDGIGFWDLFTTSDCILLEWPERMNISEIPRHWEIFRLKISLIKSDDGAEEIRQIVLSKVLNK